MFAPRRKRLQTFVGGAYSATNLTSVLITDERDDCCTLEMWSAPGRTVPTFDEAKSKLDSGAGKKISKGHMFGPSWTNHWCKMTIDIPKEWSGKEVELRFDPSCEAMIFDNSGDALQGEPIQQYLC